MSFFKMPNATDVETLGRQAERVGLPVTMPDGGMYMVRCLLTHESANIKLAKSSGRGFYSVGLSLAPWTLSQAANVCPNASPACVATCLNTAGKGGLSSVQTARIAKTRAALSTDPVIRAAFVASFVRQIARAERKAERADLSLAVRLNVLSDLAWERLAPWLFDRFPRVQFYDYTKAYHRLGTTPANYDLTFSRSESNEAECDAAIARGFRVAVVFDRRRPMPRFYRGRLVLNGDTHDLRFTERGGVYIGLTAKGSARRLTPSADGFVVG